MSSSDKIPPVLGSPSATDPEGVAADFTVAATAEAKEASAPDAVVADVAPKVSAGGRYSDAAVAVMTEDQLWTAVSAGLLTSGQMTRALQQFGLVAATPKGYQALLLKHREGRAEKKILMKVGAGVRERQTPTEAF